jgi:hypothetical protein
VYGRGSQGGARLKVSSIQVFLQSPLEPIEGVSEFVEDVEPERTEGKLVFAVDVDARAFSVKDRHSRKVTACVLSTLPLGGAGLRSDLVVDAC